MSFKFEELLSFMDQPAHIRNGVIIYENLKNWSLHDTAFRIGEFAFYNEERRVSEPVGKVTVARLKEFTIEFTKREPERDKKGNIISNGIDVNVSWEGQVHKSFTVSDGWYGVLGFTGFEEKLIDSLTWVHRERIKYFVKGVDSLCRN